MDLEYVMKLKNESGREGVQYVTDRLEVMVPYLSILVVATVTGTAGNLLVILAVAISKELRTVGNMFICNLAVADMLVACFSDIFNIISTFKGDAVFKQLPGLCDTMALLCFVGCVCSLYNICAVAINRYIHICHFHKYSIIFSRRKTLGYCLAIWLFCGAAELGNSLGWSRHTFDQKAMTCVWDRTASFSFTMSASLVLIMTPVLATALCYIKIYRHVNRQSKRVAELSTVSRIPSEQTLSERNETGGEHVRQLTPHTLYVQVAKLNAGPEDHHKEPASTSKISRSTKLLKTLFTIYVVFLVCWTPYLICIMVDFEDRFPAEVHLIVTLIAHFNSSCNSVLYAITNKQFRRGYLRVLAFVPFCRTLVDLLTSDETLHTTRSCNTKLDHQSKLKHARDQTQAVGHGHSSNAAQVETNKQN